MTNYANLKQHLKAGKNKKIEYPKQQRDTVTNRIVMRNRMVNPK